MFLRANFHRDGSRNELAEAADIRNLQEAVTNFITASQILWPFDYGPVVLLRILVEQRWGEAVAGDSRARIALVTRFFNEVASDNSGRAVRGEPPLDYEKTKSRWNRCVEGFLPQPTPVVGMTATAQAAAPAGSSSGSNSGGRGQGGSRGGGQSRARPANSSPRAVHNGRLVCFNYNQRQGCTRQQASRDACKDASGKVYAHYCNFFDKARNAFCLAMHPRCVNH